MYLFIHCDTAAFIAKLISYLWAYLKFICVEKLIFDRFILMVSLNAPLCVQTFIERNTKDAIFIRRASGSIDGAMLMRESTDL